MFVHPVILGHSDAPAVLDRGSHVHNIDAEVLAESDGVVRRRKRYAKIRRRETPEDFLLT